MHAQYSATQNRRIYQFHINGQSVFAFLCQLPDNGAMASQITFTTDAFAILDKLIFK